MKIDELHVQVVRLSAGPAEGHSGWRRHPARSLHDSLRQQHQRRQRAHSSRSAAGAGRRRGRQDQGRPAHSLQADETPMNNLLVTMLDKAGVPAETLGDAPASSTSCRTSKQCGGHSRSSASRSAAGGRAVCRPRRPAPDRRGQGPEPQGGRCAARGARRRECAAAGRRHCRWPGPFI